MRVSDGLALFSLALGACSAAGERFPGGGFSGDFTGGVSCSPPACPVTLASFSSSSAGSSGPVAVGAPLPLAVDATNVYWAYWATAMECPLGGCGSSPTQLAAGQIQSMGIAVDGTSVYWTTGEPFGTVMKCAVSGCGGKPTQLAVATGGQGYGGIAVDETSVYWVTDQAFDAYGPAFLPHSVMKCGIDNCATPIELAGGLEPGIWPGRIAIDATNVYWTNPGFGGDGTVMTCAKQGCNGTPTILASGQDAPWDIAVDATNVYWINIGGGDGAVMSCPKGGGGFFGTPPPTQLGGFVAPGGVAVDEANVYWTDSFEGAVMKCASGSCGGTPTRIASGQNGPGGIVVDANSVYWVNSGDNSVMKLTPK